LEYVALIKSGLGDISATAGSREVDKAMTQLWYASIVMRAGYGLRDIVSFWALAHERSGNPGLGAWARPKQMA